MKNSLLVTLIFISSLACAQTQKQQTSTGEIAMCTKIVSASVANQSISCQQVAKVADLVAGSSSLLKLNNRLLYGISKYGNRLFSYNVFTNSYTDIHDFASNNNGTQNYDGSLMQANNGLLYGVIFNSGTNNSGTFFSYDTSTYIYRSIHDFKGENDGAFPEGPIIQAVNGILYGITKAGGIYNGGTIFSYNISSNEYADVYNFGKGVDGIFPFDDFYEVNGGMLYGMTEAGGLYSGGTIFNYDINTGVETDLQNLGEIVKPTNNYLNYTGCQ